MEASPLNDVQTLNFTYLSMVRDAGRSDLAAACCRFGLSLDRLKAISELTPNDVIQIVSSMGSVPLVTARDDLASLLSAPRPVMPILASARPLGRQDAA